MEKTFTYKALLQLLEPHFARFVEDRDYEITWVPAARLFTHNRLDLAIKALFLKMRSRGNVVFAKELYASHIRAFTLGTFVEPGSDGKDTLQKYLADFDATYESIRTAGFDPSVSVVPCSRSGSISNGAHRVASAFMLGAEVPTVQLDMPDDPYDYRFFLDRGLGRAEVEAAVTHFVEMAENCYTAIIWPTAKGHHDDIRKLIANVVYETHISLNPSGAHNLVSQVYAGEAWLGPRDRGFPGARSKVAECFRTFDDVRVIVFQANSLADAQRIKADVRDLFQVGKHSIHINDTKDEAIRICRTLLNTHSVHFLNHGDPTKFKSTIDKIDSIKRLAADASVRTEDIVIDTGMVLALYGIRESSDIDYLCTYDIGGGGEWAAHDEELPYHAVEKAELIYGCDHHFFYEDLKFVSFQQVFEMKQRRRQPKDMVDIDVMSEKLGGRTRGLLSPAIRQRWYFLRIRVYLRILETLRSVGLYELVRSVYRRVSGKRPVP